MADGVGDIVKIVRGGERFWVTVKSVQKEAPRQCLGIVDNDLINTAEHGLKYGDPVVFYPEEVIDVIRAEGKGEG